ncbi:GAF domain-containing protein [Streptomyces sp. NPDC057638]|uniref:GAF domain-containing protein n=1 Tax=Streptomyces sp. NPDC057638 TaxID=3346190 RepID=UPI0036C5A642
MAGDGGTGEKGPPHDDRRTRSEPGAEPDKTKPASGPEPGAEPDNAEPASGPEPGADKAGAGPEPQPRPDASGPSVGGDTAEPSLPLLLEAVLRVGTDLTLSTTLQDIVDTATCLAGARYGALGVIDPERGGLRELFTSGLTEAERVRAGPLPDGTTGLVGLLVHDPQELLVHDLAADPRSTGVPEGHPPIRSLVGVPIRVESEVFGNLYLAEKRVGRFSEDDLAMLRVLASQAGIAIGNARLYETARQRERWIEGAAAVTTALLTGAGPDEALRTVAQRARILADAAAGVVLQPTGSGGMEIVVADAPDDGDDLVGTTIDPGSPLLGQLLAGEPVFIDDAANDPRMSTRVRARFGPSMMLPLQSGGRLIGTLALPRRRFGPAYTSVEKLLASQFASHAALALVLADAQHNREKLAVYEDRDRIARDLHDLVVQRLFATGMMLESTRRRARESPAAAHPESTEGAESTDSARTTDDLLAHALDELDSTIQEVRTAIFALQQPPASTPDTFRGRVLRETAGASALLGFQPSVRFRGAVDALAREPAERQLLAALRGALAAAHRRAGVTAIEVDIDATPRPGEPPVLRLQVRENGATTLTWRTPL